MKIRDLLIGDWCSQLGRTYIRIDGSFMSAVKPILMGIDVNNFGRFYREDNLDAEVEFCPHWDYVNSNYEMSGFRRKSPYGPFSTLGEALNFFVLKDEEKGEILMTRRYKDEHFYIVIWSNLPFRQGRVFPISAGDKNRPVEEYIEYHLDFEGNEFEEKA